MSQPISLPPAPLDESDREVIRAQMTGEVEEPISYAQVADLAFGLFLVLVALLAIVVFLRPWG